MFIILFYIIQNINIIKILKILKINIIYFL